MVEERRADGGRAVHHGLGEGHILRARSWISARVVVHQDDGARGFTQSDAQDIAHADLKTVDATLSHPSCRPQAVATVEDQNPELLMVESREPGTCPRDDGVLVGKLGRSLLGGRLDGTTTQLYGGCQPHGLGRADPAVLRELADTDAEKATNAAVIFEQTGDQGSQRRSSSPGTEEDGEEFGIAERSDAILDDSLRRRGRTKPQ